MDELLRDFLTESTEHLEGAETQLLLFEREPTNAGLLASIFRLVHTIKGTAGFVGLERLPKVAHAAETLIGILRDGTTPSAEMIGLILSAIDRIKWILSEVEKLGEEPKGDDGDLILALDSSSKLGDRAAAPGSDGSRAADPRAPNTMCVAQVVAAAAVPREPAEPQSAAPRKEEKGGSHAETIRVAVDTLESIMQLVSELVLTRNQLVELTRRHENDIVKGPLQRLSSLTTDLQDAVMRARMQPVGRLYSNLPRLVRELSAELGKKLQLVSEGADTEIDRQLIEVIRDPLTHLIRNCADHGIEPADERIALGKPEAGEITVSASHEAGQITISVSDDGRGLNLEKIAAKVVAQGLASAAEVQQMGPDELGRFIFEPGFSTAAMVSNVSGRGVGMDVVRTNIESIGGTATVMSKPCAGTTFVMKIPLTLAIAPALIIESGRQRFALPQHAVVEVVGLGEDSPHGIERVQNAYMLKIRDEVLPAVELSAVLGLAGVERSERLAVIMKVGQRPFAVIVETVLDVQEIVVKPLSPSLAHLKVYSGQTILGDGSVVLILDSAGIAARIGIDKTGEARREAAQRQLEEARRMKLILFRAGGGALKALPLSVVARIERVEPSQLMTVDGRTVLMRQQRLMPVLSVASDQHMDTGTAKSLLVIGSGEMAAGIVVEEISDIVEHDLNIQMEGSGSPCIGAAEVRGEPVEVLDIVDFLEKAETGIRPKDNGIRILLLSEDCVFHDVTGPTVAAGGHTVVTATSPRDLERILSEAAHIDAAVIDLDMERDAIPAWLGPLGRAGITGERLIGLQVGPTARAPADGHAEIGRRLSRSERLDLRQLLSNLAQPRSCEPGLTVQRQSGR